MPSRHAGGHPLQPWAGSLWSPAHWEWCTLWRACQGGHGVMTAVGFCVPESSCLLALCCALKSAFACTENLMGLGRFSLRAVWLPTGHHITLLPVSCNACCLHQVGPGKLREQLQGWARRAATLKQESAPTKGRLDSPGLIHMLSRFQTEPGWTDSASTWG